MPYKDPEAARAAKRKSGKKLWAEKSGSNYEARLRKRKLVESLKDVPCADCGKQYPSCVMDFDHVRGEKKCNVAALVSRGSGEAAILEEAAKCDVVCANCHRIRTWLKED